MTNISKQYREMGEPTNMFAKLKKFFGKNNATVAPFGIADLEDTEAAVDTTPEQQYPEFFAQVFPLLSEVAAPITPTPADRVEVAVGSGLGKAVVQRPYYGKNSVSLSYNSNFGAAYNAGPITLSVEEWDNLVDAVKSVLAEKPAVEVTLP